MIPGAPVDWRNWSGSQQQRARLLAPASIEDVVELVRGEARSAATGTAALRCVGSGHSFVPFWSDGVLVSLDGLSGVLEVDRQAGCATVAAGTKLYDLGPALWAHGLSLPQQGDIDRQSVAGALATGTHGTGRQIGNLSTFLRGITLVDGSGEVVTLTPEGDPEAFSSAQVSQGMLGVVVSVTLSLLPAFHLRERLWDCAVAECEAQLPALVRDHRHFEFFWTPRADRCEMKTLTVIPDGLEHPGVRSGPAYQVFPTQRDLRFNEMEYSVPYAAGWECFCELREMMLRQFPKLPWPIEYRTLAADEILLSTAYQRESVTLSVHQGADRDHRPLFDAAEAIFRNHRGRPHWGKLHSLGAADLAGLYPALDRFRAIRRRFDPNGLFLNAYLRRLFAS